MKVLNMLLRNYLEQLRRGLEKLEEYGFTESLEIKEEIRANKLAVLKSISRSL
jgi:hypothetical protein